MKEWQKELYIYRLSTAPPRKDDLQEYIDYAHKMHFAKLCYFEAADKITEY